MTREARRYDVVAAVKLLEVLGRPEEIRAEIEALEDRAREHPWAAEAHAAATDMLKARLEHSERAADSLSLDEGRLEIEFDPGPKLRQAGKTGRRTDYYKNLIANLAEATAARLEQETGKDAEPREVCEEVARRFAPAFPPDYLDPSPRGNVYNLWMMRKRSRERLVDEIKALLPGEGAVEQLIRRSGLLIAPGAWSSTPWMYLLEVLRDLAKSEAAGDTLAEAEDL